MITIQKKPLSVGKYVDNLHVDTAIRTYKKERWVHNSERIGKEDSLSGWYTIEELEEFLETSKLHGADGIRFYFGAYPTEYPEKPEYAGRQTIIFVATKQKESESGTINKDIYVGSGKTPKILAYNFARICPPLCINAKSEEIGVTIVDCGDKGMVLV
jgi:hypothetical protein